MSVRTLFNCKACKTGPGVVVAQLIYFGVFISHVSKSASNDPKIDIKKDAHSGEESSLYKFHVLEIKDLHPCF